MIQDNKLRDALRSATFRQEPDFPAPGMAPDGGEKINDHSQNKTTDMKTIKEWLQDLPDGYRELALANLVDNVCTFGQENKQVDSLSEAVQDAFSWHDVDEGFGFWHAVASGYLPPLPFPKPKAMTPEEIIKLIIISAVGTEDKYDARQFYYKYLEQKAIEAMHQYAKDFAKDTDTGFKLYLLGIAKHEFYNYQRDLERKQRGYSYDGNEGIVTELPSIPYDRLDLANRVKRAAIDSLPPRLKTVYLTHVIHEIKGFNLPRPLQKRLREHLGVSQGTIRGYKKEALDRIDDYMSSMRITKNELNKNAQYE